MSDIIKKAFENIDPEAEKRLDEKLKNGSELFGLYDVSKCPYCNSEYVNKTYNYCNSCEKHYN